MANEEFMKSWLKAHEDKTKFHYRKPLVCEYTSGFFTEDNFTSGGK
jgi:hypothetical protein